MWMSERATEVGAVIGALPQRWACRRIVNRVRIFLSRYRLAVLVFYMVKMINLPTVITIVRSWLSDFPALCNVVGSALRDQVPRMNPRDTALLCALSLALFSSSYAHADTTTRAQQTKRIADDVLEIKAFVDANEMFCDAFSVDTAPAVKAAIADWYRDNRIDNVTNIIFGNLKTTSGGINLEAQMRKKHLRGLEEKVRARASEWCARFITTLQTDQMNLSVSYTEKLQNLNGYYNQVRATFLKPDMTLKSAARSVPLIKSPTYQSQVDAGVDLTLTPIATEFRCYQERPGADYNAPDFVIQLAANNTYTSTFGKGRFNGTVNDKGQLTRDLNWTGALGKLRYSRLTNKSRYGQSIRFGDLQLGGIEQDYMCYQQGGSERQAITSYRLKDPGVGEYTCQDSEGVRQNSFNVIEGFSLQGGRCDWELFG